MKPVKTVVVAACLALAGVAFAGQHAEKTNITIEIDDGEGAVSLNLDSEQLGFKLQDMQEGETRSIIDESGRSILITREAKGFKFDVDGKTIEMPLFHGQYDAMVLDGLHEGSEELGDVYVMHGTEFVGDDGSGGIVIISPEKIDDATREGIKSLLLSSGHTAGIEFIDGSEMGGVAHDVRVIKKEIIVSD